MRIAVRLDDISPAMDWKKFEAFAALLQEFDIKPLIGVVPQNRDENLNRDIPREDFWDYVKERQKEGWVVAQHGCYHVYTQHKGGVFPLNDFSEFAGVPYAEQLTMLEHGREILKGHGIVTDLFMAPAHSYDRNTLKALKDTGFKGITDGFGDCPYVYQGLTFYPISFRFSATLKKKKGYSTMVVHTGTNTEKEMEQYEGYFQRGDVTWISYGEYLNVKAAKRGILGRCREFLMATGKFWLVKLMRENGV